MAFPSRRSCRASSARRRATRRAAGDSRGEGVGIIDASPMTVNAAQSEIRAPSRMAASFVCRSASPTDRPAAMFA